MIIQEKIKKVSLVNGSLEDLELPLKEAMLSTFVVFFLFFTISCYAVQTYKRLMQSIPVLKLLSRHYPDNACEITWIFQIGGPIYRTLVSLIVEVLCTTLNVGKNKKIPIFSFFLIFL